MTRQGVDAYIAKRQRARERRKTFWLWFFAVLLIGVHVLLYVFFSEIVEFIQSFRDALFE